MTELLVNYFQPFGGYLNSNLLHVMVDRKEPKMMRHAFSHKNPLSSLRAVSRWKLK